ncbi:MAG: CoA transferase [Actinobacteria bacterium]|nr:CoA transferase [Actinomycetota bacterium]
MTALTGIKIADFSRVLAGPYASMLLGDMGAEVIKIERPVDGDDTRTWGPPFNEDGTSTYFQSVNRNKLGVTADLSTAAGKAKALEIIGQCDVLIENFTVGTMEEFGFGYEELHKKFPKLIYCSISGFGTSELAKKLPGYDLLVQGMSGLMSITGVDSESPTKVGVALVDVISGLHAALGISAALVSRAETGIGQKIAVNLLSSALSAMVNQSGAFAGAGVTPKAMGNAHPSIAPYEVYKAKDQYLIIAVGNDRQFVDLARVLNLDIATDSRFESNSARVANRTALNEFLNQKFMTETAAFWTEKLAAFGVPAGPINSIAEGVKLATDIGLDPIVRITDSRSGKISKTIANPIIFSETPVTYRLGAPDLGADD